jgi:Cu/Ag efflux protein CusF
MPRLVPLFAYGALWLTATLTISCSSKPAPEAAKEPPKRYQLHGEVVRLDPSVKTATINAQKIEGWMEAMSMEYPVKDANDFSKLQPNECIDATVFVQGTEYWVADVKPVEAAPGACLAKPPAAK